MMHLSAHPISDSRGGKTIECLLELKNKTRIIASIPGGISTSKYEAPSTSIENALRGIQEIAPLFIGKDPDLDDADAILQSLTPRYEMQVTLPLSIAIGRAESVCKKIPFHQLLKQKIKYEIPEIGTHEQTRFFFNVLHGGAHGKNKLSVQEILLMPTTDNLDESLAIGVELQGQIVSLLESNGYATDKTNIPCWDTGKKGRPLINEEEALDLVILAIKKAGLIPGKEIKVGLDIAASQFYNEEKKRYRFKGMEKTTENMIDYYMRLTHDYPISFIEDGLAPDDICGWQTLTEELGPSVQIIGEDFFASSANRIKMGIEKKAATGAIIKPGQTATVSELLASITLCKKNNFDIITSPRSRETNDIFVTELTAACGAKQFKTIACSCPHHMNKNRSLIQIIASK